MKKIIATIRTLAGAFSMTPIEAYKIPPQPKKRDVKPVEEPLKRTTQNPVFDGKQYERNMNDANGGIVVDWDVVSTKTGTSSAGKSDKLTAWDRGFLDEQFPGGKWNETLAAVLKDHWFNNMSAAMVESKHRDKASGQLEFGYSERNVKKYFWAFNRAFEKVLEENANGGGK